jgi:type VI protein secretion system component VasK
MNLFALPAATDPTEFYGVKVAGNTVQFTLQEAVIIAAAAVAMGALVYLMVYFRRARRRARAQTGASNRHAIKDAGPAGESQHSSGFWHKHHRRRRRRHHEFQHRNPTLAETGGLPPLRPEPPSASPPPA